MCEGRFGGERQQLAESFFAEDLIDALGGAGDGRCGDDGVASRDQLEVLFRMCEGVMRDQRGDVGQFG